VRSGDWKLVRQPGNTELLFNLADDMSEKTDLLSKQPDKAKELRELLTKWESQMVPPKPRAVRKE
jgi:arylsulfatase A-like enzyme